MAWENVQFISITVNSSSSMIAMTQRMTIVFFFSLAPYSIWTCASFFGVKKLVLKNGDVRKNLKMTYVFTNKSNIKNQNSNIPIFFTRFLYFGTHKRMDEKMLLKNNKRSNKRSQKCVYNLTWMTWTDTTKNTCTIITVKVKHTIQFARVFVFVPILMCISG